MATVTGSNDPSCARSTLTVTCTIEVPGGATVDVPVTVAVGAGATAVGVTVSASISGVDPSPVTVSLPTSAAGVTARLALTDPAVPFLPPAAHAGQSEAGRVRLLHREARFEERIDWDFCGEGPLSLS